MKLSDLKAKAAAVSANLHQDVTAYITALESKVSANKYWLYGGGAVFVVFVLWLAFHKH